MNERYGIPFRRRTAIGICVLLLAALHGCGGDSPQPQAATDMTESSDATATEPEDEVQKVMTHLHLQSPPQYNDEVVAQPVQLNGKGGVVVRGEAEIVEDKRGAFSIIITSIPFRVNKADMQEKIADLVREKKIEGIREMRDESTDDIRVVIDLKVGAQPQTVLNKLYKHTQLEDTFHYNMVALVDGIPQTLSLKVILQEYIKHRSEVIRRRTQYDLTKAQDREHVLLGLKKALDHIDAIIKLIRASKDVPTAHAALMKEFKFSIIQAQAILDMRLQKLAGLERKKIEDELSLIFPEAVLARMDFDTTRTRNSFQKIISDFDKTIMKLLQKPADCE